MRLSVVIPFVNEYPQVAFTVSAIRNKLEADVVAYDRAYSWEIICVDNTTSRNPARDKGLDYLRGISEKWGDDSLIVDRFSEKQSCWGARNHGAELATGNVLWFVDAHVVPSAFLSVWGCIALWARSGRCDTVHVPLAYLNDAHGNELIYRARIQQELGLAHYVFHGLEGYRKSGAYEGPVFEVPCMSTCGMFIGRETFLHAVGGYPPELGTYGGGENYINYVLAILGRKKWVVDAGRLEHYADTRGYTWDGRDWLRNRMIAVYLAGGETWLDRCRRGIEETRKLTSRGARMLEEEILTHPELTGRRERIKAAAKTTLEDWVRNWNGHELLESPSEWV